MRCRASAATTTLAVTVGLRAGRLRPGMRQRRRHSRGLCRSTAAMAAGGNPCQAHPRMQLGLHGLGHKQQGMHMDWLRSGHGRMGSPRATAGPQMGVRQQSRTPMAITPTPIRSTASTTFTNNSTRKLQAQGGMMTAMSQPVGRVLLLCRQPSAGAPSPLQLQPLGAPHPCFWRRARPLSQALLLRWHLQKGQLQEAPSLQVQVEA